MRRASARLTVKPSARVIVNLGPSLNTSHSVAQYVPSVSDPTATDTYRGRRGIRTQSSETP